jgi:hypothetical protein
MSQNRLVILSLCGALIVQTAKAVTLDMVTVGNPGNAPDTRYGAKGFGSVNQVYQIGKYEITAGQYTEFLNAVAKADPNGLYSTAMFSSSSPLSSLFCPSRAAARKKTRPTGMGRACSIFKLQAVLKL